MIGWPRARINPAALDVENSHQQQTQSTLIAAPPKPHLTHGREVHQDTRTHSPSACGELCTFRHRRTQPTGRRRTLRHKSRCIDAERRQRRAHCVNSESRSYAYVKQAGTKSQARKASRARVKHTASVNSNTTSGAGKSARYEHERSRMAVNRPEQRNSATPLSLTRMIQPETATAP
eukprot:3541839-Pleurochrysis_carterae.AAC.6